MDKISRKKSQNCKKKKSTNTASISLSLWLISKYKFHMHLSCNYLYLIILWLCPQSPKIFWVFWNYVFSIILMCSSRRKVKFVEINQSEFYSTQSLSRPPKHQKNLLTVLFVIDFGLKKGFCLSNHVPVVKKGHCVKGEWMTIVLLIEHQSVGNIDFEWNSKL